VTDAEPLLAAHGVARRFGAHTALEPADLALAAGDAVALVGPNGAGMSTLLSLLAGALEPTTGRVERRDDTRIGWAPQRPAQYGRLTARENARLFARLDGGSAASADSVLADFDLPVDQPSDTLSVGQRQRLNLALAFLGAPSVVLLDEPTAALDELSRHALWRRVEDLVAAGGAVAFASQDAVEVERHARRVVALEDGRVVSE
jgi:ABC-type multidrug transport system ATPase subunit